MFQPSLSGNGTSGVTRVTGLRPSSPTLGSSRKSDPLVMLWCALAVQRRRREPGIAFVSVTTPMSSE